MLLAFLRAANKSNPEVGTDSDELSPLSCESICFFHIILGCGVEEASFSAFVKSGMLEHLMGNVMYQSIALVQEHHD